LVLGATDEADTEDGAMAVTPTNVVANSAAITTTLRRDPNCDMTCSLAVV
jgi:hypothetical protein